MWTDPAEQEKLVDLWRQLSAELSQYPLGMLAYEILNEAVANDPEDWNKLVNKVIADIRTREPNRTIVVGSNRWKIPDTFPDLKVPEKDPNIILRFHFYTPMALTHHRAPWTAIAEYSGPVNYPGQIVDTLNYRELSRATVQTMRNYANGFFNKAILAKIMSPAIKVARKRTCHCTVVSLAFIRPFLKISVCAGTKTLVKFLMKIRLLIVIGVIRVISR